MKHTVGAALRRERISHGLERAELADMLGVSDELMGAYEAGARDLPAATVWRLSVALRVRPEVFFSPDDERCRH